MRIMALAKKELDDIFRERVYLLAFFVQFLMVMSITLVALMYTSVANPEVLERYIPEQQLRIGVAGDTSTLDFQNLGAVRVSEGADYWEEIRDKGLVAVLVAPENIEEASRNGNMEFILFLDNTNVLSGYADSRISAAIAGLEVNLRKKEVEELDITPGAIIDPIRLEVEGEPARIPEDFVELMYGILLPFILLLPTFLATNMTTDAIVGEKEHRTYEYLLVIPINYRDIILGKAIPIAGIALVQVLLWTGIITAQGIPIYNLPLLVILLVLLNGLFIGMGVALSAVSDSIKDANVGVTVILIAASLLFFLPVSFQDAIFQLSPVFLMTSLASNPTVPLIDVIPGFVALALMALITLMIGEKLLEYKENLRV